MVLNILGSAPAARSAVTNRQTIKPHRQVKRGSTEIVPNIRVGSGLQECDDNRQIVSCYRLV